MGVLSTSNDIIVDLMYDITAAKVLISHKSDHWKGSVDFECLSALKPQGLFVMPGNGCL